MTRRIRYEVYDQANPSILISTLSSDSDRSWQDALNDVGSGQVTVGAEDPQAGDLDARRYVRCLLDGITRFAWIIEKRTRRTLPRGGAPSEKTFTVSGRGVFALLETKVVEPELGTDRLSPDTRLFNFASRSYTEGVGWKPAIQIKQQSATGDWDGAPLDWPDPDAYWIWGRAKSIPSVPPQPVGRCYFRKFFTVTTQRTVRIFVTADDGFEIYLNGALVAMETRAFMWAETKQVDVFLDVGQHLIAVVGVNIKRDSASTNVAGFILTAIEVTEGGESYGSVLVRTDSTWSALDYPSVAPTMTPGEIWRVLLTEAHAVDGLTGVTLECTDTLDSNGNAWATPVDLEVRVGTSYLQVAHVLMEMAVDMRMSPLLGLEVYNRQDLGRDLTGTVALEEGVHLSELTHDGENPIMNAALVKLHSGTGTTNVVTGSAYAGAAEAASIASYGRIEAYVELGTAPSDSQAERTLDVILDEHAWEQITVSFQTEERGQGGAFVTDERPYVGWGPGDFILVPGIDDFLLPTEILSLSVSDDPEGGPDPIYRAEGRQITETGS